MKVKIIVIAEINDNALTESMEREADTKRRIGTLARGYFDSIQWLSVEQVTVVPSIQLD